MSCCYKQKNNETKTSSIAYCTVTYIAGLVGAPEDCKEVIVYAFGKTFVRAAFIENDLWGRNGEGGDEISCKWSASGNQSFTLASMADKVAANMAKLNGSPGEGYMQEVRTEGGNVSVFIVNRFGSSAFLPQYYEISTIRIRFNSDSSALTAIIALTITVSKHQVDLWRAAGQEPTRKGQVHRF